MKNRQRLRFGLLGVTLALAAPPIRAVTEDTFLARNTKDLVELCAIQPGDPLYVAAKNFCHGYLVGVYQYQDDLFHSPGMSPMVCPPNPKPSRNQVVSAYVDWAKSHPEYGADLAVDTFMKFVIERYPCPN